MTKLDSDSWGSFCLLQEVWLFFDCILGWFFLFGCFFLQCSLLDFVFTFKHISKNI